MNREARPFPVAARRCCGELFRTFFDLFLYLRDVKSLGKDLATRFVRKGMSFTQRSSHRQHRKQVNSAKRRFKPACLALQNDALATLPTIRVLQSVRPVSWPCENHCRLTFRANTLAPGVNVGQLNEEVRRRFVLAADGQASSSGLFLLNKGLDLCTASLDHAPVQGPNHSPATTKRLSLETHSARPALPVRRMDQLDHPPGDTDIVERYTSPSRVPELQA